MDVIFNVILLFNLRYIVKNITTNKLQSDLSKVIKEVESGEIYEVARYYKSVAVLISKEKYDQLVKNQDCKRCVSDLRKIAQQIKK